MKFSYFVRALGLTTMLLAKGVSSAASDAETQHNEIRGGAKTIGKATVDCPLKLNGG